MGTVRGWGPGAGWGSQPRCSKPWPPLTCPQPRPPLPAPTRSAVAVCCPAATSVPQTPLGGAGGSSSTAGLPPSTLESSSPSGGGILAGLGGCSAPMGAGDRCWVRSQWLLWEGGQWGGGDTSSRLLNLREGSRLWLPSCPRCKRRGTGRKVINIARCHPKPSWCSPAPLTPAQPPPRHPAPEPPVGRILRTSTQRPAPRPLGAQTLGQLQALFLLLPPPPAHRSPWPWDSSPACSGQLPPRPRVGSSTPWARGRMSPWG